MAGLTSGGAPPVLQPNNRYHVFEIDTSEERDDEALGLATILEEAGAAYSPYITITAVGGGFSYKINSEDNALNTAMLGEEWEDFEITEIYVTNAAVAGTAKIHVEYRVD